MLHGQLTLRLDGGEVRLDPGEMFVVPRGVAHQPYAAAETHIMMLEPVAVVNTGDVGGELTVVPEPL